MVAANMAAIADASSLGAAAEIWTDCVFIPIGDKRVHRGGVKGKVCNGVIREKKKKERKERMLWVRTLPTPQFPLTQTYLV